jgi:hypothetical protein
MLSKVEVRNRQGDTLVMPFDDFDNGLAIADIEGLDPTKATLVSSGFAGIDGAQYYSSKREPRNLKLKIELVPDFVNTTARSLRQKLYQFLMPKTEVTLRFYEALGSYYDIVGRVEEFSAPLFTKDPVADISLMCFDPDFFDPNPVTVNGLTVTGSTVTMTTIPYLGTVETGMLFTLNLDRPISSFSIVHQTPAGDTYQLDFAETLLAGDKLVISTISGSKGASLTRNNTITSILWGVSPQARWLELEGGPGENKLRVSASAAGIPWSIQYVTRLGGL